MERLGYNTQPGVHSVLSVRGTQNTTVTRVDMSCVYSCKERHVIDLHTKNHDVVIYRENHDHITKQKDLNLQQSSKGVKKAKKLRNYIVTVTASIHHFLKRPRVQRLKDTPSLTQYALVCLIAEINIEDLTDLLGESQMIEARKRQGDILHHLADVISVWGQHTVNITGDLIYVDRDDNVIKLSKDNRTKSTLIKKTEQWYNSVSTPPTSTAICWSVCGRSYNSGRHKQTIRHGNTDQELISESIYITEERNGDVIVSDRLRRAVVVTDSTGRRRFSYKGLPSGARIDPRGNCTDALSHILVCE
ncbi:uncharacterized protein LOC134229166, partial [Saccostrea cucullata]|uniref:uncharacterized protein LOC134229166 n=1 Tax=Saccostrea cuccullata TaxID=36930 RepID=UPI002ED38B2B